MGGKGSCAFATLRSSLHGARSPGCHEINPKVRAPGPFASLHPRPLRSVCFGRHHPAKAHGPMHLDGAIAARVLASSRSSRSESSTCELKDKALQAQAALRAPPHPLGLAVRPQRWHASLLPCYWNLIQGTVFPASAEPSSSCPAIEEACVALVRALRVPVCSPRCLHPLPVCEACLRKSFRLSETRKSKTTGPRRHAEEQRRLPLGAPEARCPPSANQTTCHHCHDDRSLSWLFFRFTDEKLQQSLARMACHQQAAHQSPSTDCASCG